MEEKLFRFLSKPERFILWRNMAKRKCRLFSGQKQPFLAFIVAKCAALRIGLYNEMGKRKHLHVIHKANATYIAEVKNGNVKNFACTIVESLLKTEKMDAQFASGKNQGLDVEAIRREFPMLQKRFNGKPLIYFDSASTTHKPKRVLDRLHQFYTEEYAKPKESHSLSQHATQLMEESRKKMAGFIGAAAKKTLFSTGAVPKASTWWPAVLKEAC